MGKKRFMGEVEGMSTTHASRLGNERSGIRSHTRGWNLGVEVHGDANNGHDRFLVQITGGSHNASRTRNICTITETDEGTIRIEFNGRGYEVLSRDLKELGAGR